MIHILLMLVTALVTINFCRVVNDNPISHWSNSDLVVWVVSSVIYPLGWAILICLLFVPGLLQRFKGQTVAKRSAGRVIDLLLRER